MNGTSSTSRLTESTELARGGSGTDQRQTAIAAVTRALVEHRGHLDPAALDRFQAAGLTERDLLEIVANVAATTLTNYANNLARTEIDFPNVTIELAA